MRMMLVAESYGLDGRVDGPLVFTAAVIDREDRIGDEGLRCRQDNAEVWMCRRT